MLDHRPGLCPTADSRHRIPVTAVVANDRRRVVSRANPGHVVFVAVIVLDNRRCCHFRTNTNAGATIVVALVATHGRARSFTDANSRSYVLVADVVDDQWVCSFVPDTGIEVLKADVLFDDCRRPAHRTDAAAHISIGHVTVDVRRDLLALRPGDPDACIADVMNDVIADRASCDALDGDPGCTRSTDQFLGLFFALRGVMFIPPFFVVLTDPSHAESVECRILDHRDARSGRTFHVPIDDCLFSPLQAEFAFRVVTDTLNCDARFQVDAFLVRPGFDQDDIAGLS